MNCADFRAAIDAYLEGESSESESAEIEIHLTSCHNCQMELRGLNKCSSVLKSLLKSENPPKSIKEKVFRILEDEI